MNLKPTNAPTIWLLDEFICLDLPTPDAKLSHTVKFVNNADGWLRVRSLLEARKPASRIGEAGDPTQYQLDRVPIYDPKVVKQVKKKYPQFGENAKEVMRRLGLI